MSKKNSKVTSGGVIGRTEVGYGYAYMVFENTPSSIVGRILTILETAGLPEKQELALKGLLTNTIWDIFNEQGIFISPETHTAARVKKNEENEAARIAGLPPRAI